MAFIAFIPSLWKIVYASDEPTAQENGHRQCVE